MVSIFWSHIERNKQKRKCTQSLRERERECSELGDKQNIYPHMNKIFVLSHGTSTIIVTNELVLDYNASNMQAAETNS